MAVHSNGLPGIDTWAVGWARATLPTTALRIPIAFGVLGQSNERGEVVTADAAAYPTAFRSARNPAVAVPFGPALNRRGGWWPAACSRQPTMWPTR